MQADPQSFISWNKNGPLDPCYLVLHQTRWQKLGGLLRVQKILAIPSLSLCHTGGKYENVIKNISNVLRKHFANILAFQYSKCLSFQMHVNHSKGFNMGQKILMIFLVSYKMFVSKCERPFKFDVWFDTQRVMTDVWKTKQIGWRRGATKYSPGINGAIIIGNSHNPILFLVQ